MFRQVYFHRTLRSAEVILRSLLKRALKLFKEGKKVWVAEKTPFVKILAGEKLSLLEHLQIDDSDVVFHIKQWQNSEDKILADLSNRFLTRRLFKAFDLDMPDEERQSFLGKAQQTVESAGFDSEYYFAEDKTGDVPYNFYTKQDKEPKKLIYVQESYSRTTIREISEISAAVRGLQRGYQIHRVCFPSELKNEIEKFYYQ